MSTFEELHLSAPIAATLTQLGWNPTETPVKEVVPTAARGHNLVAVTPPGPAYAAPGLAGLINRLGSGGRGLLLAPETQLDEWGALAYDLARGTPLRVQVAHGGARIGRQLRADAVDLAILSPETALALAGRSALRTESLTGLFLAWPESWPDEASVTQLMQDLPKDAQRIIYTADAQRVSAITERYARKALTVAATASAGAPPGPVRTVIVPWARRAAVLSEIVELLDPASLVVWTADRSHHAEIARSVPPADPGARIVTGDVPPAQGTVIAFDLPTEDRLRQLLGAGEVVLLVPPEAEGYVARIAASRRPLPLPSFRDTALSAAARRRDTIARRLEEGKLEGALLTLAPLFERYDPAAVAAALLELWSSSAPTAPPAADVSSTAKIYVGTGKKDGTTANDLVAVLTKELRVNRTKIGRIELRDAYSLIEIPAQEAETVAAALNGATVRRRRVTARVDRGPTRTGGKTVERR